MTVTFISLLWPRKGLNWLIREIRVIFSEIVRWTWTFIGLFFMFIRISSFKKRAFLLEGFFDRKVSLFFTPS